jgi:CRISPR-associated protein Cas1
MIKRTLYFGNPCYLKKKDMQLNIAYPEEEKKQTINVPIEDIGLIVLDNPYITLTNALIISLNENNTALISCDKSHLPFGLMLPMYSHHAFTEKLGDQIGASLPLKKNLWQQTVISKISNQAALLKIKGMNTDKMEYYIRQVKTDDNTNVEGRAAAHYWNCVFGEMSFFRHRFGSPPNNMFNYGYAVLRAIVARSLIGSGLFPTIGIHHRNKYNPYCLADDIMEPYRPFVDFLIFNLLEKIDPPEELTPGIKKELLKIPVMDVIIDGRRSPLMIAMQRTTASLAGCFGGTLRKIIYPVLQ